VRRRALAPALLLAALAGAVPARAQDDPRLVAAVALAREGRADSARTIAMQLLAATPTADARYAEILYVQGLLAPDGRERRRLYQRVVTEYGASPWSAPALVELAQLAYAVGDRTSAATYLERFRRDWPDSDRYGDAALWGVRVQLDQGDLGAACQWYAEGLRKGDAAGRERLAFMAPRCGAASTIGDAARPPEVLAAPPAAGPPPVAPPAATAVARYRVQVAAVGTEALAGDLAARVREAGYEAVVVREGGLYKVRAGAFRSRREAADAQARLRTALGGQPFIVQEQ